MKILLSDFRHLIHRSFFLAKTVLRLRERHMNTALSVGNSHFVDALTLTSMTQDKVLASSRIHRD